MKDDIFKKLKTILSGSTNLNEDHDLDMKEKYQNDEELVNNFMNQILDAAWVEEDLKRTFAPSYHLSKKEKSYWLLNTQLKTFMNIKAGVEIFPIEKENQDKTYCLIGQAMYSVPNDILVCAGWN